MEEELSYDARRSMRLAAALDGTGWDLQLYQSRYTHPGPQTHELELMRAPYRIHASWIEGNYPWWKMDHLLHTPDQLELVWAVGPTLYQRLEISDCSSVLQTLAVLAQWMGLPEHDPLPEKLEAWFRVFCNEDDVRRLRRQRQAWEQERARVTARLARSLRRI